MVKVHGGDVCDFEALRCSIAKVLPLTVRRTRNRDLVFELLPGTLCTLSFDAAVSCSVSARWMNWCLTSRGKRRLVALSRKRETCDSNYLNRSENSRAAASAIVPCRRGSAKKGGGGAVRNIVLFFFLKSVQPVQPEGSSRGRGPNWNLSYTETIHPLSGELESLKEHLQPLAFTPKVQHEVL